MGEFDWELLKKLDRSNALPNDNSNTSFFGMVTCATATVWDLENVGVAGALNGYDDFLSCEFCLKLRCGIVNYGNIEHVSTHFGGAEDISAHNNERYQLLNRYVRLQ